MQQLYFHLMPKAHVGQYLVRNIYMSDSQLLFCVTAAKSNNKVVSKAHRSVTPVCTQGKCTGRGFWGNGNSALNITNTSHPPHMPPSPSHPPLRVEQSNLLHKTCSCSPWRKMGLWMFLLLLQLHLGNATCSNW